MLILQTLSPYTGIYIERKKYSLKFNGGLRNDRMVDGFTTTYAITAYHH